MGGLVEWAGEVRRLVEGGARHRAEHGAVRRARVGRTGDRADVARQAARRSRRRAVARRPAERGRRSPPPQPDDDARDRGGREHLRRVRLLPAGLPEPRPDHDPPPAHRPAPRDRPQLLGRRSPPRSSGGVLLRRPRYLRGRRHLCAGLSTMDRHGQAREGAPCPRDFPPRHGCHAPGAAALGVGRAGRPRRSADGSGREEARRPSAQSHTPRPLPETTREGAAAVYFPSCTNRIMGRSKRAGVGPTPPDALVAVSARAGKPVWVPPDVAGRCCGVPFSSKGHADAHAEMVTGTVEALWRWSGAGELPVVVDASSCTLGLAVEAADALPDEVRERHAKLEDPGLRRMARAPDADASAASHAWSRGGPSDLRDPASRPGAAARGPGGGAGRRGGGAGRRDMLRLRGRSRDATPGVDGVRDRARGARAGGAWAVQRLSRPTGPARSASKRATGEPFGSIVLALEEVTR